MMWCDMILILLRIARFYFRVQTITTAFLHRRGLRRSHASSPHNMDQRLGCAGSACRFSCTSFQRHGPSDRSPELLRPRPSSRGVLTVPFALAPTSSPSLALRLARFFALHRTELLTPHCRSFPSVRVLGVPSDRLDWPSHSEQFFSFLARQTQSCFPPAGPPLRSPP